MFDLLLEFWIEIGWVWISSAAVKGFATFWLSSGLYLVTVWSWLGIWVVDGLLSDGRWAVHLLSAVLVDLLKIIIIILSNHLCLTAKLRYVLGVVWSLAYRLSDLGRRSWVIILFVRVAGVAIRTTFRVVRRLAHLN